MIDVEKARALLAKALDPSSTPEEAGSCIMVLRRRMAGLSGSAAVEALAGKVQVQAQANGTRWGSWREPEPEPEPLKDRWEMIQYVLDHGVLNDWEAAFIQSLAQWRGALTAKQRAKLEAIYEAAVRRESYG